MAYNPYLQNPYFQQPGFYGGAMPDALNQMKMPYQPQQMQPQTQPTPTPQVQTSTNDIIWVQGLAGAKAYLVAPNNTVTLWDSESPTIYVKSADGSGIPSMRILDFKERTENATQPQNEHVCQCGDKFIPKSQLNEINGKFDDIFERLQALEEKPKTKTAKTTKGDAE
jgi:hypothetical protein